MVGPGEPADLAAEDGRVVRVLGPRTEIEDAVVALVRGEEAQDVGAAFKEAG